MTMQQRTLKDSAKPHGAEKVFVVFVLLLSLGAFMNLSVTGPIETQNMGMIGMEILWSLVYLIVIGLFYFKCNLPVQKIFTVTPLIFVVLFSFASAYWSQDAGLTLRRSAALALTLVLGVYFASRFEIKAQLRLLAWAFAICIVFSFFFELLGLNPSEGISGWYGIFYQKNELGRNMVLSAIVFLFWKRVEPGKKGLARVGLFASLALVGLSRSITSVVVFCLVLVLFPYLRWTLRKPIGWMMAGMAFLLGIGAVAVIYAATHLEQLTGYLGKNATLTGRVPLWILSTVMALNRPWLGYGFNAFWLPHDIYVQNIWHILGWEPPHAHNGFLELWLDLGIIGTGIFLLVFAFYVVRAVRFLRNNSSETAAWPLVFLMFLFLSNLTETCFLVSNSIFFILYVVVAHYVSAKRSESLVSIGLAVPEHGRA